jgi:L-serine deaminase
MNETWLLDARVPMQIYFIERNEMGAAKANAARLGLFGEGRHYVTLDKVIGKPAAL